MLRRTTQKLADLRAIFRITRCTDIARDPLEARMRLVVAPYVALVLSRGTIERVAEIMPEAVVVIAVT